MLRYLFYILVYRSKKLEVNLHLQLISEYLITYHCNGYHTLNVQSTAAVSPSSLIVEEDDRGYETYISAESTDTEVNRDTSNWSRADKKKLQHMTEFHTKYQHVFGEGASIRTIMKRRICHMNSPMPKIICKEEMQNAQLGDDEVIIEYITDVQGNRIKKLNPVFIKSEPDRITFCM